MPKALALEVSPSCDIHLVRGLGGVSLKVFMVYDDGSRDDKTSTVTYADDLSLLGKDVAKGTIAGGFLKIDIGPKAGYGVSYGMVTYTAGTNVLNEVIRIQVHDSIKTYWLGSRTATVQKGFDNLVLTAYAQFSD